MVNGASELNYFFLHQLAFKVQGLNGVYSGNLEDISPVAGNNLREFNEKDLGIDYSEKNREKVIPDANSAIHYTFDYEGSELKVLLERSEEQIGVKIMDSRGEKSSALRDFKWAFDRLESDDCSSYNDFEIERYSEEDGEAVLNFS